jgi:hypothetical protein
MTTSERKIAANRWNGRSSTGPRSAAGKKRASRNAVRHGLSTIMPPSAERAKGIDRLASKIADGKTDSVTLGCAYAIAEAEFDLAQVRRVKIATINRILALGELEPRPAIKSKGQAARLPHAQNRGDFSVPVGATMSPLPSTEPERTAEAVRRALSILIRLDRYERRAAVRRERFVRTIQDILK